MRTNSKNWLGIILVILGALFLLDNYGLFWFNIHPLIFGWHSFFFNVDFDDFWPLILFAIGLWLILSRRERQINHTKFTIPGNEKTAADSSVFDTIDEVCVFNNVRKTINSTNFKGGTITSIFGSVKLDLTSAILAPGENNLEINNIFSTIKIRVPQGWKVLVNVSSIFGGFEDKRFGGIFKTEESQGILVIKGATIFGGGDLKY